MTAEECLKEAVKLQLDVADEDRAEGYRYAPPVYTKTRTGRYSRRDRLHLFLRALEANPPKEWTP